MFLGAFPFQQSIIYLVEIGLFILGLLMVLAGRRHLRPMFKPGLVLMLAIVGLVAMQIYQSAMMEWNPVIREDVQVVGTWADDRETMTLHADHRFDFHSPNERFSGKWSRFDWNLTLNAEEVDMKWRFISYGDVLYLMPRQPEDIYDWDGNLGLERMP